MGAVVMAGDGGRAPDVSEQRAEPGLAEEVAWAINYLRGIQGEINDLHRDGRLKTWDRSRLHDLIRCVVDGVQGRVGLERALMGEVSTTSERSACARATPRPRDPASVLAALLADQPDATIAALETLLTNDEAMDEAAAAFSALDHSEADLPHSERSGPYEYARFMFAAACRSLRPKAPKEHHDAYVEPLDGGHRGYQARCWTCDWTGPEHLRGTETLGSEESRAHKRAAKADAAAHRAGESNEGGNQNDERRH